MVLDEISQAHHNVLGICYMIIGSIGTLGHLRIAVKYVRKSDVPSPQHFLHISLAIANLGVCIGFPFSGLSHLAGKWIFGPTACQAYAFEGMLFGIASILTTTALSLERYLSTKRTNFFAGLTSKHYGLVVTYIWLKSLFWASMPLLGWARYSLELSGSSCSLDWRRVDDKYISYILTVSALAFVLPFGIMAMCLTKAGDGKDEVKNSNKKSINFAGQLKESQLRNVVTGQAILSIVAWTPYAGLCLQFLVRNPRLTTAAVASFPPLFAKAVTGIMPLVYKANTASTTKALGNGLGKVNVAETNKIK